MTIQHETWQVFNSVLLGLDMIFFLRIFLHAFGFNEWEVLPLIHVENHPGTSLRDAVSGSSLISQSDAMQLAA